MNIEIQTRNQAIALQRILRRAEQAGLIVEISTLSRQNRHAAFVLYRLADDNPEVSSKPPIGFRYPNAGA